MGRQYTPLEPRSAPEDEAAHDLDSGAQLNDEAATEAATASTVKESVKDCEVIFEPCILCACPWAPRGLVLAAIAQVFFSVMILCVKLLRDRVPTFEIILVRQVLVYLISLAQIVLVLKRNPFGAPKDRKLLAVRGLCGFGGLSTAFYGIAKLPLTVSTLISFLNPIWSSLVAYCILHEKLSARDVAGGLIALSGTVWITHPAIIFGTAEASPPLNPFGLLASFTSGWFAAFAMVAVRQLRHESAVVLVHWFAGASVICSPLFLWIQSYETPPVMPRWTDEFWILLAITITGYIGQVLMNRAVQLEKAGRAMSMGYLQIVFAFVESATIFGAPPFWWEYVGTAFVVSGSALMICKPKKDAAAPTHLQSVSNGELEEIQLDLDEEGGGAASPKMQQSSQAFDALSSQEDETDLEMTETCAKN